LNAGTTFTKIVPKHFYVSPFSSLDLSFDFKLKIPGDKLDIKIDDRDGEEKVLISTLTGQRAELTNNNLAWFTLKYPLVTIESHFPDPLARAAALAQAVPFYRKAENVRAAT
jgi:DUF1365 family protein